MKIRLLSARIVISVLLLTVFALAAQAPSNGKATKAFPSTAAKSSVAQPVPASPTGTANHASSPTTGEVDFNAAGAMQQLPNNPLAGEAINWDVLASGGGLMSSGSFIINGTLGQAVAGETVGSNSIVNAGFWQDFGPGEFLCGDVSKNGRIDITDAVFIIQYIFASGPAPVPIEAGDVDCNSRIAISDAVYIIQYIFASGPVPCASCS